MGLFWQNNTTIQEEDGEKEIHSTKLRQSLAELECEEAIMQKADAQAKAVAGQAKDYTPA